LRSVLKNTNGSTIELKLKMTEITVQDIEVMKEEVLMHWDRADANWLNGKTPGVEMENQNNAVSNLLCSLQTEQTKYTQNVTKATESEESNVSGFS
jgi:hypothetical protein